MNEEEVKNLLILPWLRDRGIAAAELSFENSFTLRIGTNSVVIGGRRNKALQRARLDILVRRRGMNLLVVEVKEDAAVLSDDDRDQAISYARLLDAIAPFALVTNGKEFRLYDVLTKEIVDPQTRALDGANLVLPDDARLEALKLFFDLSPENLLALAHAQVSRVIKPLFGGPEDYSAVYIPDVHVDREEQWLAIKTFLDNSQPLFVLLGESGIGKTCLMIDFAKKLMDGEYPVLFFRGALVQADILDEIAGEVEWAFGPQRGSIDSLKRLAENSRSKPLVAMIDGIEDWPFSARVQNLASLVAHLQGLNVRLIISCKTASWPPFTHTRGNRTGIESSMYGASDGRPFSSQVGPLSPKEFLRAIEKHRRVYKVDGRIDPGVLNESKNSPFVLRLVFQVQAYGSFTPRATRVGGGPPQIRRDSVSFYETYLRLILQRTGQEETATNLLLNTARILYENNEEWVDEQALRTALGLQITEQLLPVLFEQRLLIGPGSPGLRRISFSFGLLRNYIIVFHVLRWPSMAPSEFADTCKNVVPATLRKELLAFYYPFAPEMQKRVVDEPVYTHAKDYLRKYNDLVGEYPALRRFFRPRTLGKIGFAGELQFPAHIWTYGFRPIAGDEEPVLLIPTSMSDKHSLRLRTAGVGAAHYPAVVDGLRLPVSTECVQKIEIVDQLEELVRKGCLDESAVPELAEELIACALTSNDFFSSFVDRSRKRVRYPVNLHDIKTALKREFIYRHFRDEFVEAKRESGAIQERWRGSIVSYSSNLSDDEERQVITRVDAALKSGENVKLRAHYVDLERLKDRLEAALEVCGERGPVLAAPVFPLLNDLSSFYRSSDIPLDKLQDHCGQVLGLALRGYRRMVEVNFPNLKSRFNRYERGPVRAVFTFNPSNETQVDTNNSLTFYRSRSGVDEVVVYDRHGGENPALPSKIGRTSSGESEAIIECSWPSVDRFLRGYTTGGLDYDCASSVLRGWIYDWIQSDFVQAAQELKKVQRQS